MSYYLFINKNTAKRKRGEKDAGKDLWRAITYKKGNKTAQQDFGKKC